MSWMTFTKDKAQMSSSFKVAFSLLGFSIGLSGNQLAPIALVLERIGL